PFVRHMAGKRLFERTLVTLSWRIARPLEGLLGTRRLQPQLRLLVAVAAAAALAAGWDWLAAPALRLPDGLDPTLTIVWLIGMACAVGAAHQAKFHRLRALILMGGAGMTTVITFVWFSAPDLALTQMPVEIVTTVLILLGLRWLPRRIPGIDPLQPLTLPRRLSDLTIALGAGTGVGLMAYAVMRRPLPDTISHYFTERAYSEGGGTNVVNVILVDFRGFDTLGEITVLGIVALTVYALLRRFRPAPESIAIPEQQRVQNAYDSARPDRQPGLTLA